MIYTIVRKEFYSNLLTARFTVGLLLCLFLAISSTFVQLKMYKERLSNYNNSVLNHREKMSDIKVYSPEASITWQEETLPGGSSKSPYMLAGFILYRERMFEEVSGVLFNSVHPEELYFQSSNSASS